MISQFRKFLPALFLIFFFIGCDNKQCEDIICPANQVCQQGNCLCANGYEGTDCLDFSYEKYQGQWNISESCNPGPGHNVFFGTIQADFNRVDQLNFIDFLGTGQTAVAYIGTDQTNQGNYIQFPNQNLGGSAFTIAGEGRFEDFGGFRRIVIDIQSTEFGQAKFCTLTYQ